jgi:MFS family permease
VIRVRTPAAKIALLGALYFAQGLPYGFQAKVLPLYLREGKTPLWIISLAGLLSFAWGLKWLWGPLVDRYGRRKTWILVMQGLLALSATAGALLPVDRDIFTLFTIVIVFNVVAATQDVAVDGLAVDLLHGSELGGGNAAQVAGYKVGMQIGGAILLLVTSELGLGLQGIFGGIAILVAIVFVVASLMDEPPRRTRARTEPSIFITLGRSMRVPGGVWLLVLVFTYKMGEQMVDLMFKPYLIDLRYTKEEITLWINLIGTTFSIGGSIVGGILAARVQLHSALRISSAFRILPLAAIAMLAFTKPTWSTIVGVAWAEEFFGGALTTVLFALMMSRVDPRIGATHFTVLATIEVLGKTLAGLPSGAITQAIGYGALFSIGTAMSVVYLALAFVARLPAEARQDSDPNAGAIAREAAADPPSHAAG